MVLETHPRATRIVCTLGPASSSPEVLEGMVRAGMDVARINFSHSTPEGHREAVRVLRQVAGRLGRPVAVLQDLQGHKVRTGSVPGGDSVLLEAGSEVLVGPGGEATPERIGVDYPQLARYVRPGHSVYVDDGRLDLRVLDLAGEDLRCRVEAGGPLGSRKGVIVPEARLEFPLIAPKDEEDARFGVRLGVDMVAMSFVRSARELLEMRGRLARWGWEQPFLVAKIEDREGLDNLKDILAVADAVLVARGDLGVSLPRERVPGVQKAVVREANRRGVPVVTATQMLESMTAQRKPTRAEVTDVHNAILDGTDAVMLSAETATGHYPVLAVEEMDRICRAAEEESRKAAAPPAVKGREGPHDELAQAAAQLAASVAASCVLGFSLSGTTLRALSAARCRRPVYGVVASESRLRQLLLHHGLSLVRLPVKESLAELVDPMLAELRSSGVARPGDPVVVVAGERERSGGRSYLLRLVYA